MHCGIRSRECVVFAKVQLLFCVRTGRAELLSELKGEDSSMQISQEAVNEAELVSMVKGLLTYGWDAEGQAGGLTVKIAFIEGSPGSSFLSFLYQITP